MRNYHVENLLVLILGIGIAVTGIVLPRTGHVLGAGGCLALAGFFTLKGASRLECRVSDVVFTSVALGLVLVSKFIPAEMLRPRVLEITAIAIVPVYLSTGLTLLAIAKHGRHPSGQK